MDWFSHGLALTLSGIGISLWVAISLHRIAVRSGASVQAVHALAKVVGQLGEGLHAAAVAPPRSASPASVGRSERGAPNRGQDGDSDEDEDEDEGEDEREEGGESEKVTVFAFDKGGNPRPKA